MLQIDRDDGIATLRLAHGKASAMDLELLLALRAAFVELSEAAEVQAIVVTGTGSIFCAGVDLKRFLSGGRAYLERFLPALDACFLAAFACEKPVIAAVNGHAIAGGCILAACCDLRLMAAGNARMGVPELKVGVPFPPAIVELLRFALAPQYASELLLHGRLCEPQEALARGLVDEVLEAGALNERAVTLARELADVPATAFAASKRSLRAPILERAERLSRESARATLELWAGDAVQSAVRRYVEQTLSR
jgi:enoyl-CoA hydratase